MASYYETSDFRNGLKVEIDAVPYEITYFQFVKPGKGTAFTRTKLKNMLTGNVIERTYRTGETLLAADVETQEMEYLYEDGEQHHFMNPSSGEQVGVNSETIADQKGYLTPNLKVQVMFYKGNPMSIELPPFIQSRIVFCEPAVKGNTATGATKAAELECGVTVQVPLFVDSDEIIEVDTRTGAYSSRVGTKK
jgi:elongation factor P